MVAFSSQDYLLKHLKFKHPNKNMEKMRTEKSCNIPINVTENPSFNQSRHLINNVTASHSKRYILAAATGKDLGESGKSLTWLSDQNAQKRTQTRERPHPPHGEELATPPGTQMTLWNLDDMKTTN
ncbi:hypothetical protein FKM82_027547 [Ascaphus truei]